MLRQEFKCSCVILTTLCNKPWLSMGINTSFVFCQLELLLLEHARGIMNHVVPEIPEAL